jgi:cyclophilin family peptidyl-prolyl cis-trans isomerase
MVDAALQTALSTFVPGAGEILSGMDSQEAYQLLQQAADAEGNIDLPKLKELILQSLPPSELAKIQEDPQYRAQQAQADAQLNDIVQSGGLTLSDKAALNGLRTKLNLDTSARNNSVTQSMAARGDLDSGAQLASQLSNNQAADTNEAAFGENIAGQAQLRALQAIQQRGQNATSNLSRKFSEDAQKAAAQDAINAGNVAIANAANTYNTTVLPERNFENQRQVNQDKSQAALLKAGAISATAKDVAGSSPLGKADIGPSLLSAYGGHGLPGQTTQVGETNTGGGTPGYSPDASGSTSALGGTAGQGDLAGTGSAVGETALAESGQSTKGKPIGGSGGGSSGSGNNISLPDGTVLEYAGLDASGLPTYRRHATPGRNF